LRELCPKRLYQTMTRFLTLSTVIISITFVAAYQVAGQAPEKHIHDREQLWVGYVNQTRFSDKWGIWTDIHYRTTDNLIKRSFQFVFRSGATYYIKDNLRINLGYAFFHHYPDDGSNTSRMEHRPWQQIWWNQKYPGLSTLQWIRLEQRFIEKVVSDVKENGYDYNFRVRYGYSFMIPLKGKELAAKTPFVAIINEVFLNLGDRITYNTFDQNRLFAGFGYQFTSQLNAQLGYMNIYQQQTSGNDYFSTHTVRLSALHSLDLRHED
jgi:hypothetical protein